VDSIGGIASIPAYQAIDGLDRPSQYASRYADEILYTDHWIGVLLRAIDEHASIRDAIVAVTADHGESLGESNRYFVHSFASTPQLAHVPLILRAPGVAPGRRSGLASHVDLVPTLLGLAGLPADPDAPGVDLGPYLREGRPLPERTVYCDLGPEVGAYRDDGFVRVLGTLAPWQRADGDEVTANEPSGLRFAWHGDGSWDLAPPADGDGALSAEIRRYVDDAVPMQRAAPRREEERLQLRALGYVVD
jgi:arylsulfatase A-like enzyme